MLRLVFLLLSLGMQIANAGECHFRGPQYELQSDTVEWEMKSRVGQSCIRGIRYKLVANPVIKIVTPPRFGSLTLQGPSFSYTTGANFQQEDSFTIEIFGSIGGMSGTSIINVLISSY